MSFGFDIDGVLYPWHDYVFEASKPYTGNMTPEEFWNPDGGWWVRQENTIFMQNMVNNPLLYYKEEISDSIVDALHKIQEITGHDFCYITGRPSDVYLETAKLLARSGVPNHDMLFFTGHRASKEHLVKERKCTYFVEDRPKHVLEVNEHSFVFLVDHLYNEGMEFKNTLRVSSVTDIPDILRERDVSS